MVLLIAGNVTEFGFGAVTLPKRMVPLTLFKIIPEERRLFKLTALWVVPLVPMSIVQFVQPEIFTFAFEPAAIPRVTAPGTTKEEAAERLLRFMPSVGMLPAEIVAKVMFVETPFRFTAFAAVVVIVLPVPCTVTVPPPVALNPVPLVVLMASPPPVKLMVVPVLLVRLTAVLTPVFRLFDAPENVLVPPPQFCTRIPVPVEVMFPEKVALPLS